MKKFQRLFLAILAVVSLTVFASCEGQSAGKKAAQDCYETLQKEGPDALKAKIQYYGETLESLDDLEDFQEEMERLGLF